jgi:WD40 repeat protein
MQAHLVNTRFSKHTSIFLILFLISFLIACASNSAQRSSDINVLTDTPSPTATKSRTPTPLRPDKEIIAPNEMFIGRTFHSRSTMQYSESLEIIDTAGTPIASFSHMRPPPGDPHRYLTMAGWSPDSRSLYYYYEWGFDGFITLWDGFNLQSINSAGGYITPLVNGLMAFSFSPNGTYLAYSRDDDHPRQLTIRNLDNLAERSTVIQLPENKTTQVGWMNWAPTEDGLIYHTSTEMNYSIYYLPLESMQSVHLLDCAMEINWCEFDRWLDNETIRVNKVDGILEIDLKSGLVVNKATSTPSP